MKHKTKFAMILCQNPSENPETGEINNFAQQLS